jgi:hypothetical protein
MAVVLSYHSADALIYTGAGRLTGFIITCSSATAAQFEFYDNTVAGGTWLVSAFVASNHPLVIFFSEPNAPKFTLGLYIDLEPNLIATVWTRQL